MSRKPVNHETLHRLFKMTTKEARKRMRRLSPRERQIAEMLAEGIGRKEIAAHFQVGLPTVTKQMTSIRFKLKIPSVQGVPRIFYLAELGRRLPYRDRDPESTREEEADLDYMPAEKKLEKPQLPSSWTVQP